MANYLTLADIQTTVCKAIGDNAEARATEVQAIINQVYLNEILCCDSLYPLFWLMRMDDSLMAKPRATITGITAASPPVVTAVAHGFADGDIVTIYGVEGMTEVNNRTFVADVVTADTLHLHDFQWTDITGTGFTAYTSGGYAHHRGITLATTNKTVEKIISADWVGYPGQFKPISQQELSELGPDYWNDSLSLPSRFLHIGAFDSTGTEGNYLMWFWCPDASYRLRLWIEFRPPRLVNTTDVPLLPYRFHPAIIAGAITRLGENKAQVEAGVVWPQIYKLDLDAIKEYNRAWWAKNNPNDRSDLYLL